MAVVSAAACAAASLGGCGEDGEAEPAQPPVRPVRTAAPAVAFAPLLVLDAREDSYPIAAERFIQRSTLKWRTSLACSLLQNVATGRVAREKTLGPVPSLDAARLAGPDAYRRRQTTPGCSRPRGRAYAVTDRTRPLDDGPRAPGLAAETGFYLDVLSAWYVGDRERVARRGGETVVERVPAYVERRRSGDGLRLHYWMLFAHAELSDAHGDRVASHEGDWEWVDVLLRRAPTAGTWMPVSATYGGSDGGERRVAWADLDLAGGDGTTAATHPTAYAARGSHGLYPRPGRYRQAVDGGRVVELAPRACARCARWRTWDDLRELTERPWYGFRGGWGLAYENPANSGPHGPEPPGG